MVGHLLLVGGGGQGEGENGSGEGLVGLGPWRVKTGKHNAGHWGGGRSHMKPQQHCQLHMLHSCLGSPPPILPPYSAAPSCVFTSHPSPATQLTMACPTLTLTPPFTLLDPHVPPPPGVGLSVYVRTATTSVMKSCGPTSPCLMCCRASSRCTLVRVAMYFALPNVLQGLFKVHTCMQHCDIMTVVMFVHISTGSHVLRPA